MPCGKVTGLLRSCIPIALFLSALAGWVIVRPAFAAPSPSSNEKTTLELLPGSKSSSPENTTSDIPTIQQSESSPELFPYDPPPETEEQPPQVRQTPSSLEDFAAESAADEEPPCPGDPYFSKFKWLGLKHSSSDGRNVGVGVPLVGTSWLNRPYYLGVDLGTVWVTKAVTEDITRDIDMFGGIYGGCDWDYYWGTELSLQRATPELINEDDRDANRGDRMMLWTASMLYYPWGDAMFRPYWRCGIGATEIDYPTNYGVRRDETLWTFPVGIGIKYPVRRWLAARAEFADQIGLGNHDINAQHDFTLTFALEWRFGAHPRSYWPWNPSRHIW